ncbi:MAG TPA: tetratricopeptide repeat protein, partial [Thermoanaerobaculia bacterium]|nr:tetratricopeptide repeat protein [Thermoanaerobaculia bacterium]
PAEALPILEQAAAGLDAAHRAGVIHRDFKSANVILVSEGSAVRAVVTDFGLARAAFDRNAAAITGLSETMGSPAYMAPEQVEGSEVGTAADVYALGVVAYEMVTGTWPFTGDTPMSVAIKRLREAPPPPSKHVPGLDPRWNDAILRCLERRPEDRFASAGAFVKALEREGPVSASPSVTAPEAAAPGKGRAWLPWAIGAAAVVLAVVFLSRTPSAPRGKNATTAALARGARRSFAVLGFRNASQRKEAAWLSTALSEMLSTELAVGDSLRSVPGENVARAKLELDLADSESYAKETLARIKANLGADVVLLGAYTALGEPAGGQVRLDIRIQDTGSGETVASVAVNGTESGLFDLVSQAGRTLRRSLGVSEVSAAESTRVRASLPQSAEASAAYADGLSLLRRLEPLAAKEKLEKARTLEPRHPFVHAALSHAFSMLGDDSRAASEAKEALDLSEGVSREARLAVEARYAEASLDWGKAVDAYRALAEFFPDDPDYALRLAEAQVAGGKAQSALETLDDLKRRLPLAGTDPRLDLTEARAAAAVSDYKRQAAAAARAVRSAGTLGARLLRAQGLAEQGAALFTLGQPAAALAACEEARRSFAEAGDAASAAAALLKAAVILQSQGDLAAAKKSHGEALALFRRVGYRKGAASALNGLASLARDEGNLERARELYEESIAAQREIGNRKGLAVALNNLASLLDVRGDVAGAEKMLEESIVLYRELGDLGGAAGVKNNLAELKKKSGDHAGARKLYDESLAFVKEAGDLESVVLTRNNLVLLLLAEGDLSGALSLGEEALADAKRSGNKSFVADSLAGRAEVLLAKGDLDGARKALDEALSLRIGVGEKSTIAETRLALARLFLEKGEAAKAETEASAALAAFRDEKAATPEALAHAVLARSFLARGKLDAATNEVESAAPLSKGGDVSERLLLDVTRARLDAASGRAEAAARRLLGVEEEAKRVGLPAVLFEARLALAEARLRREPAKARALLEETRKEAASKGFGRVEERASALLRAPSGR